MKRIKVPSNKPMSLEQVFIRYENEKNPVTRAVYRQIFCGRIERAIKKSGDERISA